MSARRSSSTSADSVAASLQVRQNPIRSCFELRPQRDCPSRLGPSHFQSAVRTARARIEDRSCQHRAGGGGDESFFASGLFGPYRSLQLLNSVRWPRQPTVWHLVWYDTEI